MGSAPSGVGLLASKNAPKRSAMFWGSQKIIMRSEANWKHGEATSQPRSDFDHSIFLWCGIIGLALVVALTLTVMSGQPTLFEGAVPP
jgi:hypothetical protein